MSVAWEAPAEAARCGGATARHRVTRSVQYFPYTDLTACCQERKKIRRWSFTATAIQLLAMARGAERLQRRQRPRPYCPNEGCGASRPAQRRRAANRSHAIR